MKRISLPDLGVLLRTKVLGGISLLAIGGVILVLRPTGSLEGRADDGVDGARNAAERARANPRPIPPARFKLIEVTAADIVRLDRQIQPPSQIKSSSSYCLHVLRVHKTGGQFRGVEPSSSEAILKVLTDEETGSAYFGHSPLVLTPSGVRFATMEDSLADDRSMEQHRDQTLAACGELGLPLNYPLKVSGAMYSLREVLKDSIANFHLGQEEIAWTAIAYALYLPPIHSWTNRYGERFSFDELAGELERRPMDQASCGGTHSLYALALLARVNAEAPVLSEAARARLVNYLARCVGVVERTQQPDGSWPAWWNHELLPGGRPSGLSAADGDANRLLMTGHLAELLLYLPADIARPQPALSRAGHWLHERLRTASNPDTEGAFCPYSHAVCVLKQISFVPVEVAPRRSAMLGSPG